MALFTSAEKKTDRKTPKEALPCSRMGKKYVKKYCGTYKSIEIRVVRALIEASFSLACSLLGRVFQ